MGLNINKVTVAGNLTRDPELRYTANGTAVGDISLATNRRVKKGEEWVDEPTFVEVTLWGRTAENVDKYLQKGRGVYVEGRLQLDQWEDKETGNKRAKLKVVADSVQFLPGAQRDGKDRAAQKTTGPAESSAPAAAGPAEDDGMDDIPF